MAENNLSRRRLLKYAAASGAALQAKGAPALLKPVNAPNVIVILVDDLGYGDLSSYGAKDLETPNMDGLGAAGIRFNNFYANSPVCSPTRAAILSGKYPDLVGVPGLVRTFPENNWGYLSRSATLLPSMLKPAGYHTAIVGKWNLGLESPSLPNDRGFDFFHGFLGDMMEDYYTHLRHGRNYMRRNREVIEPQGHATDLFTDWSIEYLKERKAEQSKFFLYLAYNAPHVPIQPPAEYLDRVKKRSPQLMETRAKMVALIEHLDFSIGRLLKALKDNQQSENTLVIFTSDNGGQVSAGASCGLLRGAKEDMFEGGIRVPMSATWPGQIKPNSRCEEVVTTMDLPPTICEVVGVETPQGLNGISVLPSLRDGEHKLPKRDLLWVRRDGWPRCLGQDYYAYRSGDWKILQNNPFERLQLYNLREDPQEEKDLSAQEPKLYKELISRLMLHIQEAGQVPWQRPNS